MRCLQLGLLPLCVTIYQGVTEWALRGMGWDGEGVGNQGRVRKKRWGHRDRRQGEA